MKILFFVCLFLSGAIVASAQTKIVTNSDLDKYRVQREKAVADYRENYAKRGMPSPEELDRRNEQDRKVLAETASRVRAERLERERIKAEYEAALRRAEVADRDQTVIYVDGMEIPTYIWSDGRRYRYPQIRYNNQPGYFAGGQFWPTGPRTQPKPLFVRPRN